MVKKASESTKPLATSLGDDESYFGFRADSVSAFVIAGVVAKEGSHTYSEAVACARWAATRRELVFLSAGGMMFATHAEQQQHCPLALGLPLLRVDAEDEVPSPGIGHEELTAGVPRARALLEGLHDEIARLPVEFDVNVGLYLACCGPLSYGRLVFGVVQEEGSGPDYYCGKNMLQDLHSTGVLGVSVGWVNMDVVPLELDAKAHEEHRELAELLSLEGGKYHVLARHT